MKISILCVQSFLRIEVLTWIRFNLIILLTVGIEVTYQLSESVYSYCSCQNPAMPVAHTHTHTYGRTHVHPLSHLLSLCHTLWLRGGYLLRHDGIRGGGNAGSLASPTVRAH